MPVGIPDKIEKAWEMNVVIEKAEDLITVDGKPKGKINPFISVRVFGLVQTTNIGKKSN